MSLLDRIVEMGSVKVEDPPWADTWAVVYRARAMGESLAVLEDMLFRWRYTGWILSLSRDPGTCSVCGGKIDRVGRQTSCDNACRQARARCRTRGVPTDFEARVEEAKAERARIAKQVKETRTWGVRHQIMHHGPTILPPNWSTLQHAPVVPPRCGGCGTGSPCEHTGGGVCVYSGGGG